MSVQSDAAKAHLRKLFNEAYPPPKHGFGSVWQEEYAFDKLGSGRKWRFDYAVVCDKLAIELDGGTFQAKRTGHASGTGLRAWREKNNAAMRAGWRVWHYAPEEIIKAGRKRKQHHRGDTSLKTEKQNSLKAVFSVTLPDEPILTCLPWIEKRIEQQTITLISPANLPGIADSTIGLPHHNSPPFGDTWRRVREDKSAQREMIDDGQNKNHRQKARQAQG